MLQKIIQVGNSLAITIPKSVIDSLGVTKRNFVQVLEEPQNKRLVISFTPEDKVAGIVDPEVYLVAKKLLKRYLPAFKALAKK